MLFYVKIKETISLFMLGGHTEAEV